MPAWKSRLRDVGERAKLAAEYERLAHARRGRIDQNTVFYESFSGNGMLCNPEAIFRALLASDDMGHLKHVWALENPEDLSGPAQEFAGDPRVSFVPYKSAAYYSALATSKYLVNNATFPPQFGKRAGQIYVNTWHGTPLKAMGYHVPGGAVDTRNVVRNFLSVDYLLAPNADTDDMYLSAYRMRNIYRGAIVHEGTPRVDCQFADVSEQRAIRSRLKRAGVVIDDDQQIILYAPTWKGDFYAPTNDIRQLRARVEAISAQIDTSKYRLLLKVHQQVYKHAIADKGLRTLLVPNDLPANDMLAVTDVLVTDYSSIFIDFLATGRPVLFYTPDIDEYESSRGFYLPFSEWPGPVCRELDEIVGHLKSLNSGGDDDAAVIYRDKYEAARQRYCAREDGQAARRVIDVVFRGKESQYDVRRGFDDGRTSVLIHLGGMLPNGITASGLCLLDNIDHERFDVTVTYPHTTRPERLDLIKLINHNVRVLPRFGGINGGKLQVNSLLAVRHRSAAHHQKSLSQHRQLLEDEWVRCFGNTEFDHVVDFSGYAPFWIKLFSTHKRGSFSIWLHNDIRAEIENAGRSAHLRASLDSVAGLYNTADRLVSVSSALAEVNATRLADEAPADRFTYARNTVNFQRVLHLAYGVPTRHEPGPVLPASGADEEPEPVTADELVDHFDPLDLTESIDRLMAYHGIIEVSDEVRRRATVAEVLPSAPGVKTFVTVGRLSPEKNQARLIRAFDLIHQENPNTRLVILGSGPSLDHLTAVIEELGLTSAVNLAGHQPNPYVIVTNSDCFVLSSDYEGQPMVLLEALILGRPIVTTSFGSVRGALPEGYGKIVACNTEALAEGMRSFLRGGVAAKPFDYAAYNRDATEEFYHAIGAV
jgi:CDP-glycerol glycerophosphotransferase (TagB/SpsB family)/glycosyltransferase involved in cell wall biosynthesis